MPNSMSDTFPLDYMATWEKRLEAECQGNRNQRHAGSIGSAQERSIQAVIRAYLPDEYCIGTGEIRSPNEVKDAPSPQADIVIYRREFPRIQIDEKRYAYIPESVLAIIEVKTKVTRGHVDKFLRDCIAWKCIEEAIPRQLFEHRPPPRCFLFALSGPRQPETLFNWVYRACTNRYNDDDIHNQQIANMMDGIFAIGTGCVHQPVSRWIYWHEQFISDVREGYTHYDHVGIPLQTHVLAMMLFLLIPDKHIAPGHFVDHIHRAHKRISMRGD